jgi:ABC-type polar amino acid transport system ATPase subunit
MSILYGFYHADSGEILINGGGTLIPDSQAAIRAGIGMVFQHFKLVENFPSSRTSCWAPRIGACCARRSPARGASSRSSPRSTSST